MQKSIIVLFAILLSIPCYSQSIKDLDFLIGEWNTREDIKDENWWEESMRTIQYVLDSSYIEIRATANSSSGKKRKYRWYIHYNSKKNQFEMVSMFSNWHKAQFDILIWDPSERKLTIKKDDDPNSEEYHERYGEMVFDENFNEYIWTGENKYGDRNNPGIWNYVEKGWRTK